MFLKRYGRQTMGERKLRECQQLDAPWKVDEEMLKDSHWFERYIDAFPHFQYDRYLFKVISFFKIFYLIGVYHCSSLIIIQSYNNLVVCESTFLTNRNTVYTPVHWARTSCIYISGTAHCVLWKRTTWRKELLGKN